MPLSYDDKTALAEKVGSFLRMDPYNVWETYFKIPRYKALNDALTRRKKQIEEEIRELREAIDEMEGQIGSHTETSNAIEETKNITRKRHPSANRRNESGNPFHKPSTSQRASSPWYIGKYISRGFTKGGGKQNKNKTIKKRH